MYPIFYTCLLRAANRWESRTSVRAAHNRLVVRTPHAVTRSRGTDRPTTVRWGNWAAAGTGLWWTCWVSQSTDKSEYEENVNYIYLKSKIKECSNYLHHSGYMTRIQYVNDWPRGQLEAQLQAKRECHCDHQQLFAEWHWRCRRGAKRVGSQGTSSQKSPSKRNQAQTDDRNPFDPVALCGQVIGAFRTGISRHRRIHAVVHPAPCVGHCVMFWEVFKIDPVVCVVVSYCAVWNNKYLPD